MEDSLLTKKINLEMCHSIEENAWASDFITPTNFWNIDLLSNILPNYIVSKVKNISVHVTDPKDRIRWQFTSREKFSVQKQLGLTITRLVLTLKCHSWIHLEIKFKSKDHIFACKLIHQTLLTRYKREKMVSLMKRIVPYVIMEENYVSFI